VWPPESGLAVLAICTTERIAEHIADRLVSGASSPGSDWPGAG
jgi:hypothetical protein